MTRVPMILNPSAGGGRLLRQQKRLTDAAAAFMRKNWLALAPPGKTQAPRVHTTSLIAFFSFLGSMTTNTFGNRSIARMPLRLRNILRNSRFNDDCIFFE